VNEVSFRARPYHNVHIALGVDTRATGPLMEGGLYGGGGVGRGGEEWKGKIRENMRDQVTGNLLSDYCEVVNFVS
jgi:hypothetical protein